MKTYELKARAKINLSLDVLYKRPDGYHEVKMLMQTLELHDNVVIKQEKEGIRIFCNSPFVPNNSQNIAYKAAELFLNKYQIKSGLNINIKKKIPVSAGLAGGSSNAAAVIKGLNEMFSQGVSDEDLMKLGKEIGADVPYCIKGGTMLSEGIGEKLTDISPMPQTVILLVKPKIGVSTALVYKNLNLSGDLDRPDTDSLIKAIGEKDILYLADNMKNVLESVTIPMYPVIKDIKNKLIDLGAAGSMMSGSGPTVFGIFTNYESSQKAFEYFKNDGKCECILTKTSD